VLLGVVVLVAEMLLHAPTAQAAPTPKTFTTYLSFNDWDTHRAGSRDGVGDLSVFTGPISATPGGTTAGTYTITARVIAREGSGSRAIDVRDTRIGVDFADGAVLAQGVTEDPKGKPPTGVHILPVVGGTGSYATARGTLIIRPLGSTGVFSLAYDVFVDGKSTRDRIKVGAPRIEVVGSGMVDSDDPDEGSAPWSAAEPGDVIVTTRESTAHRVVTVSTVLEASSGRLHYEHELLISTEEGGMIARGETVQKAEQIPGATKATFTILGGTKDAAGRRGELRVVPTKTGGWDLRVLRGPQAGGKVSREGWFDDPVDTVTVDAQAMGDLTGEVGQLRNRRTKGADIGDFAMFLRTLNSNADGNGDGSGDGNGNGSAVTTGTYEVSLAQGTMIATGILDADAKARTWIVIGGTGNYGGAAGVGASALKGGVWKTAAKYRR
jgi:hypothetical protein